MNAAVQRAAQRGGATSHSRKLAAFLGSATSRWHWVFVAFIIGVVAGVKFPWERCPLEMGTKREGRSSYRGFN